MVDQNSLLPCISHRIPVDALVRIAGKGLHPPHCVDPMLDLTPGMLGHTPSVSFEECNDT